ncbi:P-loop NTPase [Modestobacter sp. I12A-02628]|uniref:P-loop NTPase n=1 Tax=Goekera deserti TaxID=2497753 RepID=A0A7K3WDH9_9ACTN|nr:P-loop NTPase [Goekera deserti]MPQ97581.1 P-loop NTPase [Goekera deserti]NDI47815.1 P-loop NTPase [Goekera deserti]NEL53563.1 P-loop NTPase [Goekera deserti]
MTTVLTIGVGAPLAQHLDAVSSATHLGVAALEAPGGLMARLEEAGQPEVLVLGTDVPLDRALGLAAQVDVWAIPLSVVLVGPSDPDLWVAAMRSGVRDVLGPDAGQDDVAAVLHRCGTVARARAEATRPVAGHGPGPDQGPDHRVVVVASAKGGVGKTTVSTNLAVGLARSGRGSTVIVDLDMQFGDVASALALAPEFTLPDTVNGAASSDPLVLKTFLTRHPSGLYVVAGSDSPAAGDAVTSAQVAQLIATLSTEFRYVVVDTAPGLSDHTLTVLEQATDLVLMSGADVPGVRGMRKELDVLQELALVPARRHLVLNMWDAAGALSTADIETTIGAPLDVVLPRAGAVALSTNTGVPLLQTGGRDAVTKGLQTLLGRFLPDAAPSRPGLLGRLRAGAR